MEATSSSPTSSSSASSSQTLFSGGLLPHLLRRLGIDDAAFQQVRSASVIIVPLCAWLPLLVISAFSGTLVNRSVVSMPFLLDLGAHVRLLVVLPLLLIAGRVAERRIGPTIRQFVTHFIVPQQMIGRFEAAIASAYRLSDSDLADIVTLVLIFGYVSALVWQNYVGKAASTWYATPSQAVTPAGFWYVYVSLPIFQFVLLRWYYRLFIWARFLAQVSKMNLHLVPTHPDRVGGLGFLFIATQSLAVFAMAHGALLAGWLANRVLIRGVKVTDFKTETILVVVFVLCITIAPLLTFTRPLILAKRRGIFQYGALASRYVYDFDRKWNRAGGSSNEELVGSADVQSLADMGGSYELVQNMRSIPITPQLIVTFTLATLVPVFPLLLTAMPLSELIKKLSGILF